MTEEDARLRSLFYVGVFSLTFPLMAIINKPMRTAWLVMTGVALVGTIGAIGSLLRTTSGLKREADAASEDTVTGLMNADSLIREIEAGIGPSALAVFDIDDFRTLNETIGRDNGDRILRIIADRMVDGSRGTDVVARIGADRFAVVFAGVADDFTASEVATRHLSRFFEPAVVGGLELDIAASVGIALGDGALDGTSLLKHSILALEAAKAAATTIEVYRPEHESASSESLAMITQVRRGLERSEFEAYLQPIVDNWNGRTLGFEALVRWNHPDRGVIPAGMFLEKIENLPVGRDFSDYMLRASLKALASLGNRNIALSINLSVRDVEDLNLPLTVRSLLEEYGIAPRRLTLEVPESVGSSRRDRTERVLMQLRDIGCGVAIDDFGGSSVPMDFLASLPVTELKIAARFVVASESDSVARTVIRHCVGLGHGGGLRVTAKGVERQAQHDAVVDLGCDASQGFHFAHPMPARAVVKWLENDRIFTAQTA